MIKIAAHYNEAEEPNLLERIADGDEKAFQVIFDRYNKGIYRYCTLMLGDKDVVNDVYQETFLTFYKKCREGVIIHNVRGYLVSIARSRSLDYLNQNRKYVSLDELPESMYELDIAAEDTKAHIRMALMLIPEQYREAFILFTLKEYSYDEIGRMLGVSRNVVRNRIYRAKQGLQKILDPLLQGSTEDNGSL